MAVDETVIEEKVKEIVTRIVRKPDSAFTAESTFKELNADSLDIVQMLVALEDAFDIEIQDEELRNVTNMGGFVDYIKRKVAEKG
jgi:acyl carrier protein